jgi:Predicted membrane protein (DUF2157)
MHTSLAEKLFAEGLLTDSSKQKLKEYEDKRLFSVYWELKTILYLGVLLLSGGLGILVYKNIDSIGHQAILFFIALISIAGFVYCYKTKLPFSTGKVAAPNSFFDYILLLACLTFITFIGYLQYQYHFFGDRFGLVTFVPMLVLFFTAYFFDHLGILSLAITNLAAWAGIAVTPVQILKENNFNNGTIIITAIVLGIGLIATARVSRLRNMKSHFAFSYTNFGVHLLFIATLAGLFEFENIYLLWFLLLVGIAFYFYKEAMRSKSFYLLLVLTLYGYIGLSYVIMRLLFYTASADIGGVYLAFLYFIGSAVGLILFLIRMNKKIKTI